jgi:predicted permease
VRFLNGVGRLAPGVSIERAREELAAVAAGVAEENPESNETLVGASVVPLRDVLVGDVQAALWVTLGAVGLILLIACANVANLLLARGRGRRSEVAVRMSLGAGRRRIVRQLLAESLVLGLTGGLAGVGLAFLSIRVFLSRAGDLLPRSGEVGLDASVLAFALGLTGLTTVLFGVLPALRAAGVSLDEALREGGRAGGGGGRSVAPRRVLVAGEVAVAVVLLVGSALLVRSLTRLYRVDPGFDPEGVATMTYLISTDVYPEREDYMAFYRRTLEAVGRIAGVEAVGTIRRLPPRGGGEQWEIAIPGIFEPGPEDDHDVDAVHVGGDAFGALGVRVLEGRVFDERDGSDAPRVVVVDETLVERFFGGRDPVGRSVTLGGDTGWEIIGVVEAVHHHGLAEPPRPTVYVYQEQNSRVGLTLVARTRGEPEALLPELRNALTTLDPNQPITELAPASAALDEATARPRFLTSLMGAFAGLAAVLAGLGVYGVIAYTVRQRLREIGLRMALGARGEDVVGMVVRQGMAPAILGLALGLAGAALLSRFLESLLFEVEAVDPAAYGAAALLLGLVALAACVVPAARASRLQPMGVLRNE